MYLTFVHADWKTNFKTSSGRMTELRCLGLKEKAFRHHWVLVLTVGRMPNTPGTQKGLLSAPRRVVAEQVMPASPP